MRNLLKKYRSLNDFTRTFIAFIGIILTILIIALIIIFKPIILIIVPIGIMGVCLWQLALIIAGVDSDYF